jgi:predicted esterase
MQSHSISIAKTARYWTLGNLTAQTRQIWFVCHGYGQLAEYFIKKFEVLDTKSNFIVAPEALSRFYLDGFAGKVGATWMTKEDRLHEITDYINYLNQLYAQVLSPDIQENPQINIKLLGFSQGTSTMLRWAFEGKVRFDELIVWAGSFPHDLDYSRVASVLEGKKVYFIYGKNDELIKPEIFETQMQEIAQKGIHPEVIVFDGKHELNEGIIQNLGNSPIEYR